MHAPEAPAGRLGPSPKEETWFCAAWLIELGATSKWARQSVRDECHGFPVGACLVCLREKDDYGCRLLLTGLTTARPLITIASLTCMLSCLETTAQPPWSAFGLEVVFTVINSSSGTLPESIFALLTFAIASVGEVSALVRWRWRGQLMPSRAQPCGCHT